MGKRRYITGFDGLRAMAVMGVMLFHLMPTKIVGGWLGVPLFFVLSGYLITDLLIQEYDNNHAIAPIKFYIRRLKRLYPALVGMLLISTTIILLFDQQLIYNLRHILMTNLLYVYNFWAISNGQSYFQQFGGASPFTHLWSLSIEGQFYLIWPFVVWGVLKLRFKRVYISLALLIVSGASAILMALLYQPGAINRAYYGTDTRLFAILLGSALAFTWASTQLRPIVTSRTRNFLNGTGAITFLIMVCGFLWLNGQKSATYYGLMYLFTLVITVLIAVIVHPASWFSKAFDNKFLNYLGTRSYSIYLYQLPVFVFYEKFMPHFKTSLSNMIIEVIIVIGISELSYRYVERIFRYTTKITHVLHWFEASRNRFFGGVIVVLGFVLFLGNGLTDYRAGIAVPETKLQKEFKKNEAEVAKRNAIAKKEANKSQPKKQKTTALTTEQKSIVTTYGLKSKQYLAFKDLSFKAVGDSVMLDAAPYLQEVNSNMVVDAEVGRQSYQTPQLVAKMSEHGDLAPNMLIGLGTNGDIKRTDLDQMMTTFGKKRQIYWMNNFVQSRSWQNENNKMLAEAARHYPNLHVINWFALAEQHLDWFADDGVHPGPMGDRNYVRLLVEKASQVNHIK
ncbi:acyltransferase family protein [Leuconostoc sp. MS02]|uniref:Acyltransferase family protein n=1 Tax=Leuconostoc aquikimchii TaxID=3236804 RepID=A0ABV3S1U2_9LACO